jgi:hypothetical protein
VSSIIAAMAIGGAVAVRSTARSTTLRSDTSDARFLATAGIEAVRAVIASDSNWRTNRSNGTWFSNVSLVASGAGAKTPGNFTVSVVNPSGALNRSSSDSVTITSVGAARTATHTLSATLGVTASAAYTCVNTSAFAAVQVNVNSASITASGQILSTNGLIVASLTGNNVPVDVESGLLSTGLVGFTGKNTVLSTPRTYPDSTAFDWYSSNGTSITYTSLPSGQSGRIIDRQLLSPTANPFGATASNGIYVINCGGGKLTIQDSRIVGTLVVLNASLVVVQNSVNWAPASSGMPALMVQGPLQLAYTATNLNETLGVNFNPSSTPYPYVGGTSNSNQTDSYPSAITGLVYASGDITTSNSITVHSLITRGTLNISGTLNLRSDFRYASSPPPGFCSYTFGILDNSYQ